MIINYNPLGRGRDTWLKNDVGEAGWPPGSSQTKRANLAKLLLILVVMCGFSAAAQIGLPYTETFSGIAAADELPAVTGGSWARSGTAGVQPTYVTNESHNRSGNGDSQYMAYRYSCGTAYYFVGPFNLTGGVSYTSSVLYKADGASGFTALSLTYGDLATEAGQTNTIVSFPGTNVVNTAYDALSGAFTPAVTGSYYLAVRCVSNSFSPWYLCIDDFKLNITPSCFAPTGLAYSFTGASDVNVSWNVPSVVPSAGYEYAVTTSSTPPASGTATPSTSGSSGGLLAGATYYLHVRSDCGGGDISSWATLPFTATYCSPAPTSVDNAGITKVVFGSVSNSTTTETNNYGDYSALSSSHGQGTSVTVAITYQTGYDYLTKIWIDWNRDWDFDDAGEEVYSGVSAPASPTTLNASFVIPLTTPLGNYRMRIGGTDVGPPTTCYTGTYGTYEDYSLTVTPPPSCAPPTMLSGLATGETTADIQWAASSSSPSNGYQWEVRSSGAPGDPSPAASGMTAAGIITASATGLSANTIYTLYVRSDCGSEFSTWESSLANFATPCASSSSIAEDFEAVINPELPSCWSSIIRGETVSSFANVQSVDYESNSGSNAIQMYNSDSESTDDIIFVSPRLTNLGAGTHQLRFYADADTSSENIVIGTLNGNDSAAIFTPLQTIPLTTTMTEYTVYFASYTGSDSYIGFRKGNLSTYTDVYIDDVIWELAPTCTPPINFIVSPAASTAQLTWNGAASQGYDYEIRTSGTGGSGPGDGYVAGGSLPAGTTLYNIADLTASTTYTAFIRSNCGGGDFSSWISADFATTIVGDSCSDAQTIACGANIADITLEGSSNEHMPVCGISGVTEQSTAGIWYKITGTGDDFTISTGSSTENVDTRLAVYTGTCGALTCVAGNDDSVGLRAEVSFASTAGADYYILLYAWNNSSLAGITLTATCTTPCTPATTNNECADAAANVVTLGTPLATNNTCASPSLGVSYPSCGSSFGTFYDTWYSFNSGSNTSLEISAAYTGTTVVGLAIYSGACGSLTQVGCNTTGTATNYTLTANTDYIIRAYSTVVASRGDFTLSVKIPCLKPTGLTVTGVTTNAATLNWTASASVPAGGYDWEIRAADGTTVIASGNTATLTASVNTLATGTIYNAYVRSVCGVGDNSPWSAAVSFATECDAVTVFPWTETFEDDSVTLACFKVNDGNSDGDAWSLSTSNSHGGTQSAQLYTDFNSANQDYLITPKLSTGTIAKRLRFWARSRTTGEPDEIAVKISTTGTAIANFTATAMPSTLVTNATYTEYTVDLSAYTGDYYIAFVREQDPANGYYLNLDDVVVENIPPTILSFTPSQVCSGGTDAERTIVITGNYFTGATSVKIDSADVQSFTVNSDTQITAVAGTTAASGLISVTGANGTGASSTTFTINENPAVDPISPAGPFDICVGGSTVLLTETTGGGVWISGDTGIATVDDGEVTAVAAGSTTISYRVTDPGTGCSTDQSVTVNVTEPITSADPANTIVAVGDNTQFTVASGSISGNVTGYQWQMSTTAGGSVYADLSDGGFFSGTQTNTLAITAADNTIDGYNFRLVIEGSASCGDHTTLAALLTVSVIGIIDQPDNVTLCSTGAGTAQFQVVASGSALTYQWYISDGFDSFPLADDVLGDVSYTGSNTDTLNLSGITTADSGYFYYVIVTSEVGELPYPSVTSNSATLLVNEGVVVTDQPDATDTCRSGGVSNFMIAASGAVNSITWLYSATAGGTYSPVVNNTPAGATYSTSTVGGTSTLTVTNAADAVAVGSYFYKAQVNSAAPCSVTLSDPAALNVTSPTVGINASSTLYCSGSAPISLTGTGAGSYTWSPATGLFTDAAGTVAYVSNTAATTVYAAPASAQVYTVTGNSGGCTATQTVSLTTGVTPGASITASKTTICAGDSVTLTGAGSIPFTTGNTVAAYNFVSGTSTYVPLSALATPLTDVLADTGTSPVTNIGFTFNYAGTNYTQFRMASDGFITFNTGGSTLTNNLSSANGSLRPVIAPLWDDMDGRAAGGVSFAGYEVTGTAPNRVLTVEWRNWEWNYNAGSPVISFQARLHETTNVIEFAYRQDAAAINGTGSATIGINNPTGNGSGSYLNVTSVSTPAVSSTTASNSISAKPANNALYTFIPSNAPAFSYAWYTSGNPTPFATSATTTVSPSANTTYILEVTSASGCSATASIPVVIQSGVVVDTAPAAATVCQGSPVSLSVSASGPGLTYQWRKGGENVTGNASATTATLSIASAVPADSGSYDVVITPTCGAPVTTTAVAVLVNPTPTITAPAAQTVCAGVMTTGLPIIGTPDGVTFDITGGSAIGLADVSNVTAIPAFMPTTGSATLTITPNANGCGGTPVTVGYVVSATPPAITVTPSSATLCEGNVQQLSVPETLTPYSTSIAVGSGTSVTPGTSTGSGLGPNPFQAYYGGTKQQWIYRAAELTALGFKAGTVINAIKIDMAAADATVLDNMIVKMKNSTKTSFTSTSSSNWETGMTEVKPAGSYTPNVGLSNITLTTPFTWDGTNSLVIEINYTNNNSPSTSTNSAKYGPTTFVSTMFYRNDNTATAVMNAYAMSGSYTYSSRNNVVFDITNPVSVAWSSTVANSLFTDAAGTTAYVAGTSATTIYAKPSADATITATASTAAACTTTAMASIAVTPKPTVTAPATQTVCTGSLTSPIAVTATPSGVTFDISGGSSIGLSDQTDQTEIPAFTATGSSAVITLTPHGNGCTGTPVTFTYNVSPVTVGGSVTGGTSPINTGQSTGTMTLSGYTGSIIRWESSVDPFSVWTPIANTAATYTDSPTQTTRYRAVVQSGACAEMASDYREITVNGVTFGSIFSAEVCMNSAATITVNGLIPNSTSSVSFTRGGVSQPAATVVADASGTGSFDVLVTAANQNITVTQITRTDVTPNASITPSTGNSINLVVSTGCTAIFSSLCGTTLSTIDQQLMASIISGATGYRWRVTRLNADLSPSTEVQTLDTGLRVMRLTQLAQYRFDTTYKIEVATRRSGVWGPFGPGCNVTTPVVMTNLVSCPQQVLTSISNVVYANLVPFATGYRFTITDPVNAANTQTLDRATREFRMDLITAFTVQYNKVYNVEVAVRNTDGTYMPFSASGCTVKTPAFPTTSVQDTQCDDYLVPSNSTGIYAYSYPGAIGYAFLLTGPNGDYATGGVEVVKNLRVFSLNDFADLIPGATYDVRVRLIFDYNDPAGPYGKVCSIVVPGALRTAKPDFNAVAYPNPFADNFNIDVTTSAEDNVSIKVYDMTGRLLETHNVHVTEIESLKVGDRFPSGVYNVIVSQGEEVKTLRVVKR